MSRGGGVGGGEGAESLLYTVSVISGRMGLFPAGKIVIVFSAVCELCSS